jgi:hypothetical protein
MGLLPDVPIKTRNDDLRDYTGIRNKHELRMETTEPDNSNLDEDYGGMMQQSSMLLWQ